MTGNPEVMPQDGLPTTLARSRLVGSLRLTIKQQEEILPEAWRIRKLKAAIPRENRVFVGALPKLPKIPFSVGTGKI
jgi:hypothetical protein